MTEVKQDWYRNKTWNPQIEVEFEARLEKARRLNKAQYIRIQAEEIKDHDQNVAIRLFNRVLDEYKNDGDGLQYQFSLSALGEIYLESGEYKKAEDCFRQLQNTPEGRYGHGFKHGVDGSDVKLVKTIIYSKQVDKYQEMYTLVKKHDVQMDFLKSLKFDFVYHASILCYEMGKLDEAKEYAQMAVELLNDPIPSAYRHPGVGDIKLKGGEVELLNKILKS